MPRNPLADSALLPDVPGGAQDRNEFHYSLPPELIAQHPTDPRPAARLLTVERATGGFQDCRFSDLEGQLRAGDLLVINDTRVIPARLLGHKDTGGAVELMVERLLDGRRVLAQCRASKALRAGRTLNFGGVEAQVVARRGEFYELSFSGETSLPQLLERIGHVPLPPYIQRSDEPGDRDRYQTVYAREPGAVAAPTAGLHFDRDLIGRLKTLGIEFAAVTLHVGAGTFQPIRVEDVRDHRMHAERLTVGAAACEAVNEARHQGRRVIAVGTTVVRALETAGQTGTLMPFRGETEIFIRPGYDFRIVDGLITNFHLPGSTLLMLVCAFAGTELTLGAYRHAVRERYRFYSYGDAMLIAGNRPATEAGRSVR